jgi:adenosylhomocysteine nucleosidase
MLGIIGALDEEIALLVAALRRRSTRTYAGISFYRGVLAGQHVVICSSGVGKVNAAMATQILIDIYKVRRIVFTGTAGSLRTNLNIGDVVISTVTQQYDVNFAAIGFPRGVIPFLKTSIFAADPTLIRAAKKGAKSIVLKGKVISGKILSGDRFVANKALARDLRDKFRGSCVEAEGAATGQVCFRKHVPYIVIRGMSDRAGRQASKSFDRFSKLASRRAQRVVLAMLRQLRTVRPSSSSPSPSRRYSLSR